MSEMSVKELLIAIFIGVLVLAVSLGWTLLTWGECRSHGNSMLYCLKLVSR